MEERGQDPNEMDHGWASEGEGALTYQIRSPMRPLNPAPDHDDGERFLIRRARGRLHCH